MKSKLPLHIVQSIYPIDKQLTLLIYLNEIVLLSDNWLDSSTPNEIFTVLGQLVVVTRSDRPHGQHGGSAVLHRKASDITRRDINNLDCDFGVSIAVKNPIDVSVFICVYLHRKITSKDKVLP